MDFCRACYHHDVWQSVSTAVSFAASQWDILLISSVTLCFYLPSQILQR